jgi:DNA-binding transcriptional LysR family regulator
MRTAGWVSMTDLNSLAIFAKVIEANSFSKAARWLNMPISTVSRRVAELENELGACLIERSTRHLRLTDIGMKVLTQARRSVELSEAVAGLKFDKKSDLYGVVHLSTPPNISDTLIAPVVTAFQVAHPGVRVQILVAARPIDHLADGADIALRVGQLSDSSLTVHKVLTYRHQLVASPRYLEEHRAPTSPEDLPNHHLIAFSPGEPEVHWSFRHIHDGRGESICFRPYLAMNDFTGLIAALAAGTGIGDLPPIVKPELLRDGRLVEVMSDWHFPTLDLSVTHLCDRHLPPQVVAFKDFICERVSTLFPLLPA